MGIGLKYCIKILSKQCLQMEFALPTLLFLEEQGRVAGCRHCFFALAIEPLAEAIRLNDSRSGLRISDREHKITLYADDVLIIVTNPETSIPCLIEIINIFSCFSGYKINVTKSEAMPLGLLDPKQVSWEFFPF